MRIFAQIGIASSGSPLLGESGLGIIGKSNRNPIPLRRENALQGRNSSRHKAVLDSLKGRVLCNSLLKTERGTCAMKARDVCSMED